LEKESSERVCHPLRAEDGHAFLGGFLEEMERAWRWPWPDGTFRPWAGVVNAVRAHARLARKKKKVIMVVSVVLAFNALDLIVFLDLPIRVPVLAI
jgi:hypothetical protein